MATKTKFNGLSGETTITVVSDISIRNQSSKSSYSINGKNLVGILGSSTATVFNTGTFSPVIPVTYDSGATGEITNVVSRSAATTGTIYDVRLVSASNWSFGIYALSTASVTGLVYGSIININSLIGNTGTGNTVYVYTITNNTSIVAVATSGTVAPIPGAISGITATGGVYSDPIIPTSTIEILIVAGGGSGGNSNTTNANGGGGGGGVVYVNNYDLGAGGSFPIAVGAGGVSIANSTIGIGNIGGNSSFGNIIALGGGGGGSTAVISSTTSITSKMTGGSGGGAAQGRPTHFFNVATQPSSTSSGYGNPGGGVGITWTGAGGGGAAGTGNSGNNSTSGGDGGYGYISSITGTIIGYAGGGGGGGNSSERAGDGWHGGGRGAGTTTYYNYNVYTAAVNSSTQGYGTPNAVPNTGGGGGGGSYWAPNGGWSGGSGAGGSGVVIIKRLTSMGNCTGGTTSTSGLYTIHTFTTTGTFTVPVQTPAPLSYSTPADIGPWDVTVNGVAGAANFSVGSIVTPMSYIGNIASTNTTYVSSTSISTLSLRSFGGVKPTLGKINLIRSAGNIWAGTRITSITTNTSSWTIIITGLETTPNLYITTSTGSIINITDGIGSAGAGNTVVVSRIVGSTITAEVTGSSTPTLGRISNLTVPGPIGTLQPTPAPTVYTFTATGTSTWTCPAGITSIEVLVVGGGGGGGGSHGGGGGGGAGGVVYHLAKSVVPGTTYNITVGAGGQGGRYYGASWSGTYGQKNNSHGFQGKNSSFSDIIAQGGGGGNESFYTDSVYKDGGSGGGAGDYYYGVEYPGASRGGLSTQTDSGGGIGYGFPGGSRGPGGPTPAEDYQHAIPHKGAGGGGAGGTSTSLDGTYDNWTLSSAAASNGGVGLQFDISGTATWYAGGGGGGQYQILPGDNIQTNPPGSPTGYLGGGGRGRSGGGIAATAGTANTGGGGGGGSGNNVAPNAPDGGSGIVIIRTGSLATIVPSPRSMPAAIISYNINTANLIPVSAATSPLRQNVLPSITPVVINNSGRLSLTGKYLNYTTTGSLHTEISQGITTGTYIWDVAPADVSSTGTASSWFFRILNLPSTSGLSQGSVFTIDGTKSNLITDCTTSYVYTVTDSTSIVAVATNGTISPGAGDITGITVTGATYFAEPVNAQPTIQILSVAGGGGGGGRHGGGGGGGGVSTRSSMVTAGTTYNLIVGDGGLGAQTDTYGRQGKESGVYFINGAGSVRFDGTGDYLGIASTSTFSMPNDFTAEAWIFPFPVQNSYGSIFGFANDTQSTGWSMMITSAGKVHCNIATFSNVSTNSVNWNAWNHIAMVRSGSTVKRYINGVLDPTTITTSAASGIPTGTVYIGTYPEYQSARSFNGYISNARVVKGTAVYTNTFTPSSMPLTTSSQASSVSESSISYLAVAGGGGGGGYQPSYSGGQNGSAGGGGGQVKTGVINAATPQTYTIVVGAGGLQPPSQWWGTAYPGGTTYISGNSIGSVVTTNGGSGGAPPGQGGTSGSGYAGAARLQVSPGYQGGSGGGDSGPGVPATYPWWRGNGGPGTYVAAFSLFGDSGYFGGGGAGQTLGQWATHPDYMAYNGSGWTIGGGGSRGDSPGQPGAVIIRIPLDMIVTVAVTGNPTITVSGGTTNYRWTAGTGSITLSDYTSVSNITGTSLLACQNSTFVDNANGYTITSGGDAIVSPFNPFNSDGVVGGGGGGAYGAAAYPNGTWGGSGGGGGHGPSLGSIGVTGQGNRGGDGGGSEAGGGGGAGAAGNIGIVAWHGGSGGSGKLVNIARTSYYWGGGGGGSGWTEAAGSGGIGGGGGGGVGDASDARYGVGGSGGLNPGADGVVGTTGAVSGGGGGTNTGGGGGGGGNRDYLTYTGVGGNGGSGIVMIGFLAGSISATGGTPVTTNGYTIHSFASTGTATFVVNSITPANAYQGYTTSTRTVVSSGSIAARIFVTSTATNSFNLKRLVMPTVKGNDAGIIGTVSGSGPWTFSITNMSTTGWLSTGTVLTSIPQIGDFGVDNVVRVTGITSNTEITCSARGGTAAPNPGRVFELTATGEYDGGPTISNIIQTTTTTYRLLLSNLPVTSNLVIGSIITANTSTGNTGNFGLNNSVYVDTILNSGNIYAIATGGTIPTAGTIDSISTSGAFTTATASVSYEPLTFVTTNANLTVITHGTNTNVTISKIAGGALWDHQAYMANGFTAPCTLEFYKNAALTGEDGVSYAMIGWNADPTTNASYNTLDWASYPYRQDLYSVHHNGTEVQFQLSWNSNDKFYIVYTADGYIKHYNGSKLLYSVFKGTGQTVYVDSSFYSQDPTYSSFREIRVLRSAWNGASYSGLANYLPATRNFPAANVRTQPAAKISSVNVLSTTTLFGNETTEPVTVYTMPYTRPSYLAAKVPVVSTNIDVTIGLAPPVYVLQTVIPSAYIRTATATPFTINTANRPILHSAITMVSENLGMLFYNTAGRTVTVNRIGEGTRTVDDVVSTATAATAYWS